MGAFIVFSKKEKLVDEYLGVNEKIKNSNLETKSTKRTFLQKLFRKSKRLTLYDTY